LCSKNENFKKELEKKVFEIKNKIKIENNKLKSNDSNKSEVLIEKNLNTNLIQKNVEKKKSFIFMSDLDLSMSEEEDVNILKIEKAENLKRVDLRKFEDKKNDFNFVLRNFEKICKKNTKKNSSYKNIKIKLLPLNDFERKKPTENILSNEIIENSFTLNQKIKFTTKFSEKNHNEDTNNLKSILISSENDFTELKTKRMKKEVVEVFCCEYKDQSFDNFGSFEFIIRN